MMNTLVNLPHAGLISVTGEGAKSFLQGQLTCHLEEITQHEATLAARCNLQGRVRALLRLSLFPINESNRYLIRLPESMMASLLKDLAPYALFSKSELGDLSSSFTVIGLVGEKAEALLNSCFNQNISLKIYGTALIPFENTLLQVMRLPGDVARFEITGPQNEMTAFTHKISTNCEVAEESLWEQLDIQAGIPNIFPQTQDQFLPHHLNLDKLGALHFKKGCYLGQEIIARMHYKGKIKKNLYRFTCETQTQLPSPGTAIVATSENEISGNVVNAFQDANFCELLAIVDNELSQEPLYLSTLKGPKLTLA